VTTALTFSDPFFFAVDVPDQGKTGKKELLFSRIIMLFFGGLFSREHAGIDGTKIRHCMRDNLVRRAENL